MKIQAKLALSTIGITAVAVGLVGAISVYVSTSSARQALEDASRDHVLDLAMERRDRIVNDLDLAKKQISTLAADPLTHVAARDFRRAYTNYPLASVDSKSQQAGLDEYYRAQFGSVFQEKSGGAQPPIAATVGEMTPQGRALQQAYISLNPSPLGQKDAMLKGADKSEYSEIHGRNHPYFRAFIQNFSFYDVFLIDPETADIVYTVFKELDFGNNVHRGALGQSGIARAFDAAMAGAKSDFVHITDFEPYIPSYNDPAAFVSTPIMDGSTIVAVLVLQISIDRVGAQISRAADGDDKSESVRTVLIGADGLLRSVRPQLKTDKAAFLSSLTASGVPADVVRNIERRNTTIGLEQVRTPAAEGIAKGTTGTDRYDYLGVPQIAAFVPFEFDGKHWGVVAEQDESVALAAAGELRAQLLWVGGVTVLVMLLVAAGASVLVSRSITKPIQMLASTIESMEANSDLTVQVPVTTHDEVGAAAMVLNRWIRSLASVMQEAQSVGREVASSAKELSDTSQHVAAGAHQQTAAAHESLSALEETSSVAASNEDAAKKVQALTNGAGAAADHGFARMSELNGAMGEIERSSVDIVKIIKVIDEIAFQTNILALNAAVEAARAGRHGRGFAVVAQEVQNLAGRSARAAKETAGLIESSGAAVKRGVSIADETSKALSKIVTDVRDVRGVIEQVTRASSEQKVGIEQVRTAMQQVNVSAEAALQQSSELAASSAQLSSRSMSLYQAVHRFKLEERPETTVSTPSPPATRDGPTPKDPPVNPRTLIPLDRDERGYAGF